MFSELRKKMFLSQVVTNDSSKRHYLSLFGKTEKYEIKFDKELCQFSTEELQEMLDSLFNVRSGTQKNLISRLNTYLNWAVEHKFYGASNSLNAVNIQFGTTIQERMIGNPMHLSIVLDKVFRPAEDCTVETIYRAVYWLAFCGVDIDVVNVLTRENIDLQNMTVTFKGKTVRLLTDAVPAIRICMDATQLKLYSPHSKTPNSYTWCDRADGDFIFRGIKGKDGIAFLIINAARKMKQASKSGRIKCNLTYETIKLSGLFYRIHEAEVAGVAPDFYWLAERMSEGKEYKTDGSHTRRGALIRVANTYKQDYESWKNAFYK